MNLQHRARVVLAGCVLLTACGDTAASTPTSPASPPPTTTPAIRILDAAVQVVANGCRHAEVHGAGMVVAEGRIATVAHVIAGAKQIEVRGTDGTVKATVVYFDPVLDVAVLKVDRQFGTPIAIGAASPGDRGSVIVYRDDAPTELPVEIQRLVNIRTADIYGDGTHTRPGYELTLDIHAGDSGAVVVIGNKAVALVWATSRLADARAWAMRTSLVTDHLSGTVAVDHGQCP